MDLGQSLEQLQLFLRNHLKFHANYPKYHFAWTCKGKGDPGAELCWMLLRYAET